MDQSLSVIGMWGSCVRESTACCSNKQARFHNAETHCQGIITQKHFVKKLLNGAVSGEMWISRKQVIDLIINIPSNKSLKLANNIID
jgi:hypothetical protein